MRIENMSDVAKIVRQRRRSLNYTQTQLAQKIGASREWVIRLEKGYSGLEVGLVLATLHALNIKLTLSLEETNL